MCLPPEPPAPFSASFSAPAASAPAASAPKVGAPASSVARAAVSASPKKTAVSAKALEFGLGSSALREESSALDKVSSDRHVPVSPIVPSPSSSTDASNEPPPPPPRATSRKIFSSGLVDALRSPRLKKSSLVKPSVQISVPSSEPCPPSNSPLS